MTPNSALATLQALMAQGQQGQANPQLAQMMGQGGTPPAPQAGAEPDRPTIMQAPQTDPTAPQAAPTAPPGPPTIPSNVAPPADELKQLLDTYKAKADALDQQLQQFGKTPDTTIPPELADFDKYNEAKYQQAYGGGGVLGTAGRALANMLSGLNNNGKSIRDTLTAQNQKEWQTAVQAQQARLAQQRAAMVDELNLNNQRLAQIKAIQEQRDKEEKDRLAQLKIDTANKNVDSLVTYRKGELDAKSAALNKEANTPFASIRDQINKQRKAQGGAEMSPTELANLNEQLKQMPATQTQGTHFWQDSENNMHATPFTTQRTPEAVPNSVPELGAGAKPQTPNSTTPTVPSTTPIVNPTTSTPPSKPGDVILGKGKLSGTEQTTRDFARTIEPKFDHVNDLITTLDKHDQMNYIASHWHDFMEGTLGHDPTYDADYTRLKTAVGLIASGLSRVHNPRGASTGMIQKLEENMKADRMDAATLKAGLAEAQDWVHGYAHIGETPPKSAPKDLNQYWKH